MLAIHSFGRVVHRHERDAIIQRSATCDSLVRNPRAEPRRTRPRRSWSSPSIHSRSALRQSYQSSNIASDTQNPFLDPQPLTESRRSWDSTISHTYPRSNAKLSSRSISIRSLRRSSAHSTPLSTTLDSGFMTVGNSINGPR